MYHCAAPIVPCWSDKAKYDTGGFRQVWESIRPHFEEVPLLRQPRQRGSAGPVGGFGSHLGSEIKDAADQLPLEQLERGLRILHAHERLSHKNLDDRGAVLEQITGCIREYDRGQSEEYETLRF
jgi:hypothetical protein